MLAELPEGYGLAARYPGDAGIAEDPAVLFADGFEEVEGIVLEAGSGKQKGNRWDLSWGVPCITREAEHVHSGRQALQLTHAWPRSQGAEKRLFPGVDTLFVRYYMKYAKEYPGCHHTGMAVLGSAPGINLGSSTGVRPDGRNHFTALLDTIPPRPGTGEKPPGYLNIYCYHMDQGRKWGDLFFPNGAVQPAENEGLFGEEFVPRPLLVVERGQWVCYELMVQANTPGKRDGRIAFWVDGRLAGDFPNLRLRSVETLKANHIVIVSYSSSTRPHTTHWYDDVVAATTYIGPRVP
ncbi:MAG: hypothetical protein QHJ73_07430 [Armatimonadota bacterium]|nr:hypothetical protein [Armatimonadota bacterium]